MNYFDCGPDGPPWPTTRASSLGGRILPEQRFDKLTCLSIAPLLSQAIREVFEDGSVTKMFDGHA